MSKVSVLVVDDATFIRDLVKKGLRDHFPGIQIDEAVNGRKAQQMLARQPADLGRDSPHFRGGLHMVFRLAVRKVEPDDVDAGANQGFENLRVPRGGPESGDNFGEAGHGTPSWWWTGSSRHRPMRTSADCSADR